MISPHRFQVIKGGLNQITYIRRNRGGGTVFNISTASASATATAAADVGHKVIMAVKFITGSGATRTVTSVTDSKGNTWSVDVNAAASPNNYAHMAICSAVITVALPASWTVTVNFSSALPSGSSMTCIIDEWKFPANGGVDTTANVGAYSASSTLQLGATTTALGLVITASGYQSGTGTIVGPPGYVALDTFVYYILPTTKQQFSATVTWDSAGNYSRASVAYLP